VCQKTFSASFVPQPVENNTLQHYSIRKLVKQNLIVVIVLYVC
jgi:hypothetical protein